MKLFDHKGTVFNFILTPGVSEAFAAYPIRKIHSKRLSVLLQCIQHDGWRIRLQHCVSSFQGRHETQERVIICV
jgi:hypothetical protein